MPFWIVAFVMAAAVAALMLLALRRAGAESRAAEADMQVYRDQLKEVDRDVARGVLSEAEAETIRIEVSRRLLEADRQVAAADGGRDAPGAATGAMAALTAAVVVGGTIALYLWLGAPGYPDLPLAARIEMAEAARANRPDQASAEAEAANMARPGAEASAEYLALMERLRATVAERPDDVQGHRLLARNEAALGNYVAARAAQDRVVALLGETATAQDLADQADLMVLAAGGYVSPEAEAVLARALARDPRNGAARYYSGLLMAQTGRGDLAFQLWDGLLRESAPTDPWVPPIRAQIRAVAEIAGVTDYAPQIGVAAPAPGPGPTAEQIEAASEMSDAERMEMIRGMVEGLSDRLATEGGPPEDWARLIGALGVLGNAEQAAAIAEEAEQVFAGNDAALSLIAEARMRAGLN
jgi:cytochrome c-type biogenesis protein CcmH